MNKQIFITFVTNLECILRTPRSDLDRTLHFSVLQKLYYLKGADSRTYEKANMRHCYKIKLLDDFK